MGRHNRRVINEGEPLPRLVAAAERIADALEYLARNTTPAGRQAHLKVARAPGDVSRASAVTLAADGNLTAIVQNTGEADTQLERPAVRLGEVHANGAIIDRDSRPQPSATVPAAPGGPGVVVQFELGREAHVLGELPLMLRLPHAPGRFPGLTVLEVRMEPSGEVGGRVGWRVVDSQEVPEGDGAA